MNRDDIIRMARGAGCGWTMAGTEPVLTGVELLERFAFLIAAAEREECAQVCDAWSKRHDDVGGYCATAIRARRNT